MLLSRERVNASGDGTLGKVQEQKIPFFWYLTNS